MGAIFERIAAALFRILNRRIAWHRMPFPISVLNLVLLRFDLRHRNLYDTERSFSSEAATAPPVAGRSADGAYNDLSEPSMGQAGTRFGRNMPIEATFREHPPGLYDPNPRLISNELLARGTDFKPVPHLNVLAAGWLQFMVHDWFSHGSNVRPDDPNFSEDQRDPLEVPLPEGDDWHDDPMIVFRTRPDTQTTDEDEGRPATYRNVETHWWDGSQLYGSSRTRIAKVRQNPQTGAAEADGKIHLDESGHLPIESVARDYGRQGEIELTGVNGNWWIGLSLMHTLFAREHNAVCDRLKIEYPNADGDWLFEKARLIVAALLAKIHTVEWTPALLNTPTMRYAMRANWWGLQGEAFIRGHGRTSQSEIMGGIIGSAPDHHAAPYAMTEEFTAVYRMHSLMPDAFVLRRHADDSEVRRCSLLEVAGEHTHTLYTEAGLSLADCFYSLGTENPGLLTLNNFPETLRKLPKQPPSKRTVDLAAIDILRDRERGVPRYCEFRRLLRMKVPKTFRQLTGGDKVTAKKLEDIYGSVEKVDLLVGSAAEKWPKGFGFSDTAFRIFILMASRRLKSDRFFTTDFTPAVYTPVGIRWVADNGMHSVILRHMPQLAPDLTGLTNAFFLWKKRD